LNLPQGGVYVTYTGICLTITAFFAAVNEVLSRFNKEFETLIWIQNLFGYNLLIQVLQFAFVYFVASISSPTWWRLNEISLGVTNRGLQLFHYYSSFALIALYPVCVAFFLTFAGKEGFQNTILKVKFGSLYSGFELNASKYNVQYVSL
jgi:hypothetical protein